MLDWDTIGKLYVILLGVNIIFVLYKKIIKIINRD